jgi:hypothetical protein
MPDTTNVETPAATPEAPVEILTPKDATAERIARGLSPEQAKAFRALRKEKKAMAKQPSPAPVTSPGAEAAASPAPAEKPAAPAAVSAPEAEVINFAAEEPAPEAPPAEDAPVELSEDELAKLDEKARKRITEASKEAAKVRKRAQEAEAKLKEQETEAAELKAKLAEIEKQGTVADWAENAKAALALLSYHEREVKAGRRSEEEVVTHTLPSGQEVELRPHDLPVYQQRIADAQQWFTHDAEVGKVRESASKLAEKHAATKGYKEARESYLKDAASLPTRLEELVAKAALYDVLQSRRAVITFPDAAGAANKAPSPAEGSPSARKTPPSESPASTPRLAEVNAPGSDLAARKSQLMQKAMTAKTEDERQKYLKEAIKLGPVQRTARRAA